jgi:hypothetical protein
MRRRLEPVEGKETKGGGGGRDTTTIVSCIGKEEDAATRQGFRQRLVSSSFFLKRRSTTSTARRRTGCLALLSLSILLLLITIHLTIGEYAWVRRRCWLYHLLNAVQTAIPPNKSSLLVQQKVECWEAKYHQKGELEPRFGRNKQQQHHHDVDIQLMEQGGGVAVDIVHYTITSHLDEPVWQLWECSMEATERFCPTCQVHIWLVSPDQEENDQILLLLLYNNHSNSHHPNNWCIHVPPNQTMIGNSSFCSTPFSATATTNSTTATPPTLLQRLQTWLLDSNNARRTLPAHLSDGWRIVTLLEYGGNDNNDNKRGSSSSSLYLDADVVPISSRLFSSLPENFIPMQNSVGSYKLNGGVLRLSNSNNNNANTAVSGSGSNLFLQALAEDYLEWAPQLAQYVSLEQQTFGFLGPAALTRTFLDLSPTDKSQVVLLPPHWVEPSTTNSNTASSMKLCQKTSSNSSQSVAIHWSSKRKRNWVTATRQNACLKKVMSTACPIVFGTL